MQWFKKRPALHFWLIGLLAFALQNAFAPEPVLQVDYPSASRIAELERQWQQLSVGVVTDANRQRMIQTEIDQSILLSEAIRLNFHLRDNVVQQRLIRDMRFMHEQSTDSDGELLEQAYAMSLHMNDLVVRRRLIQMMESVLRAPGETQVIEEQALRTAYAEAGDKYAYPDRFSFIHVFVSRDRHRGETGERAKALFQKIEGQSIQAEAAVGLGDPFVTGHAFRQQSLEQIGREFGNGFAAGLSQCAVGDWCEAVASVFGLHHLWLEEKLPSQPMPFETVKGRLEYELRNKAGEESLAAGLDQLRARYQVVGGAP